MVSSAQRMAASRSAGADSGAGEKPRESRSADAEARGPVEMRRTDQYRWTNDKRGLPSAQSRSYLGGSGSGRRVAE